MMCVHARSEMPYACSVCGFRSSFHKDVIDHFQVGTSPPDLVILGIDMADFFL